MVTGYDLRYPLSAILARERRTMSVSELTDRLDGKRLTTRGRSSKSISDALRREVGKGRVIHCGRGSYRVGTVPRVTLWRIRKHVALLERLANLGPSSHLSYSERPGGRRPAA